MSKEISKVDRGFIVVTVALVLVVVLAFAALAADVGVLYSYRTAAQEVVDAAALAGASTFVLNPTAPQPATAIAYATNAATNQGILGRAVTPGEVTVTVADRVVTVQLDRVERTFFTRVVGLDTTPVSVRARAEASNTSVGATCVKPFFMANTVLLPAGSSPCDACNPANPEYSQVLVRGGMPTAYALSRIGTQFTIRPWDPFRALAPGQFYSLAINGRGGEVYRTNIATCIEDGIFCGRCYEVEPGAMVGPTRQGVTELIGNPPDVFHGVGDYGDDHRDTSRSLVVVPVWDICFETSPCPITAGSTFCPDGAFERGPDGSGRNIDIRVAGFALAFIVGMQGNGVQARLINVFPCSGGGSGNDDVGPYSVPLRLVRPAGS